MPVIGTQQSPIQIIHDETIVAKVDPITYSYAGKLPGKLKDENYVFDIAHANGQEITTGKTLTVGNVTWVIRKIHIHSPAEHLLDENPADDFECHLVHSKVGDVKARGPKLVVGVMFKVAAKASKKTSQRPTMFSWNAALCNSGTNPPIAHDIDVNDFLPDKDKDKFYRYEGSLTSDPYSEDVSWYVLKHHSEVLPTNVDQILKFADQHTRPVHATDRRFILRNFP